MQVSLIYQNYQTKHLHKLESWERSFAILYAALRVSVNVSGKSNRFTVHVTSAAVPR